MDKKSLIVLVATRTGFWEGNEVWSNCMPPVGLLAISSFLIDDFRVEIVDQRIKGWQKKLNNLLEESPLFVGISFMTGEQIRFSLEASMFVRKKSSTLIVAGGVHPTLCPEQVLNSKSFDIAILGEGEETIRDLALSIKEHKKLDDVKGIAFLRDKKVVITEERELVDLNKLTIWPYHLVDLNLYPYLKRYGLVIETSRGCPFKCSYCYNAKFSRGKWRAKSADKVVEEISFLKNKFDINHFHVIDDNFFVDLNRAKEIIKRINELDKHIKLEFQGARADSILNMDDDFLQLLKNNDCTVRIGIETGSQSILDLVNKSITIEEYSSANRKLSRFGIKVYYNFMIGFPFEKIEDLKKTTKFATKLMEDNKNARIDFMAIYQPYPGTALFDFCVRNGYFKIPATLIEWADFNWEKSNLLNFSKKEKKLLRNISIISQGLMIRKNSNFSSLTLRMNILARIYRYVIKFRMKYFCFNFLIESIIIENIMKQINKKEYLIN